MKVNKDDDNDEIKLTVCLRTTICKGNWCWAKILWSLGLRIIFNFIIFVWM